MVCVFKNFFNISIDVAVLIVCVAGKGWITVDFLSVSAINSLSGLRYYELRMKFFDETNAGFTVEHIDRGEEGKPLNITTRHDVESVNTHFYGRLAPYIEIKLETYRVVGYDETGRRSSTKNVSGFTKNRQTLSVAFPHIDSYSETFRVSVSCAKYYYNPIHCVTYCEPHYHGTRGCTETGIAICFPGWRGVHCTEDVDECVEQRNACKAGETCLNTVGSYTCKVILPLGEVGECADHKGICRNGGTCKNTMRGFLCFCPLNYRGPTCAIPHYFSNSSGLRRTGCAEKADFCEHGGTCVYTNGSFICACSPKYGGPRCSQETVACSDRSLMSCQNDGVCMEWYGVSYCQCTSEFSGKRCEHPIQNSSKKFHINVIVITITMLGLVLILSSCIAFSTMYYMHKSATKQEKKGFQEIPTWVGTKRIKSSSDSFDYLPFIETDR